MLCLCRKVPGSINRWIRSVLIQRMLTVEKEREYIRVAHGKTVLIASPSMKFFRFKTAKQSGLLISVSLVFIAGQANGNDAPTKLIVFGQLPPKAKSILELRVERVDLEGYRMNSALWAIQNAVHASTKHPFSFSLGTSRTTKEEPGHEVRIDKWLRNPNVRLHMANTTLCAVVNELCAQSG